MRIHSHGNFLLKSSVAKDNIKMSRGKPIDRPYLRGHLVGLLAELTRVRGRNRAPT